MKPGVTVIVPSIPQRGEYLGRALASVAMQSLKPDAILVRVANDRMSAPYQRDELLAKVETEWVAPLDDDDWLYPHHLRTLMMQARALDPAPDLVYPWFDVHGGTDPFPQFEGQPWDDNNPHQIPITALFRTESVRKVGGWSYGWDLNHAECPGTDRDGNRAGEDFALVLRMVDAGMKIVHVNERTWSWRHHEANSMGLPSKAWAS